MNALIIKALRPIRGNAGRSVIQGKPMASQRTRDSATKLVITAIAYWCVWIYLIRIGPMKTLLRDGPASADAPLSLAFIGLGTLLLSIGTWRKYRQVSGWLGGRIEAGSSKPERSRAGAKWLGVLAWLALGVFVMVFPALFLGSTAPNPVFIGAGVFAWLVALWVALTSDGKPRDSDCAGIDIDLDP